VALQLGVIDANPQASAPAPLDDLFAEPVAAPPAPSAEPAGEAWRRGARAWATRWRTS
jgi:hypothetical protein